MTGEKMKGENGEHPLSDTGQLVMLCLFLIIWMVDSFILKKSTFLSDYVPLSIRIIILSVALITAANLIMSGHRVVSHDQDPKNMVSTGAFRYIRHPLYLGSMLFYLGLVVFTASLFSLIMLAVIFVFYNYIASYEEKLLEVSFGDEYRNYKKRTGKWVPKFVLES